MRELDIILLTETRFVDLAHPDWYARQILDDDALLTSALQAKGLRVLRVDWADTTVDWSNVKAAVFRTTWDYFHRFSSFSAWLDVVEQQTLLINPPELIRWNWDKHYLRDLEQKGIRIPETIFIEPGDRVTLAELHLATGWNHTVLKPAISGGGRHTYRLDSDNMAVHEEVFGKLVAQEAMLLQPFQDNVLSSGEVSMIVIDGIVSHAVLKKAKEGDYRVQDDFGGKAHPYEASEAEKVFAMEVVAACQITPAYARVDMIWDNDGQMALSELELIEPELWLRHNPPAAELFANAILKQMEQAGV